MREGAPRTAPARPLALWRCWTGPGHLMCAQRVPKARFPNTVQLLRGPRCTAGGRGYPRLPPHPPIPSSFSTRFAVSLPHSAPAFSCSLASHSMGLWPRAREEPQHGGRAKGRATTRTVSDALGPDTTATHRRHDMQGRERDAPATPGTLNRARASRSAGPRQGGPRRGPTRSIIQLPVIQRVFISKLGRSAAPPSSVVGPRPGAGRGAAASSSLTQVRALSVYDGV